MLKLHNKDTAALKCLLLHGRRFTDERGRYVFMQDSGAAEEAVIGSDLKRAVDLLGARVFLKIHKLLQENAQIQANYANEKDFDVATAKQDAYLKAYVETMHDLKRCFPDLVDLKFWLEELKLTTKGAEEDSSKRVWDWLWSFDGRHYLGSNPADWAGEHSNKALPPLRKDEVFFCETCGKQDYRCFDKKQGKNAPNKICANCRNKKTTGLPKKGMTVRGV